MGAGSIIAVVGSVAVSAAIGTGVYVAIKEARLASAAENAAEARPALPPGPRDPDRPATTPPAPDPGTPTPATEEATTAPARDPATAAPPAPGEMLGTPGVAGGLEVEAVTATLRDALPRLQQCEVVLGGKVEVTLEVNRRGGITSTKVDAGDEALGACAAKALQQIRFARTTDGKTATVVVPLAFERGAAPCDEVSCVLDNYVGACCAKFRRGGADTASQPEAPTRDEIMTALRPARRAVSTCAVTHNYEGTLKVRFTITPEGTVTRVGIEDVDAALVNCVARVIRQHTFSKTRSGATVSFPFTVPL